MTTKDELLEKREDIRKKILHLEWDLSHNQAGFKNQAWLDEQKKILKDIEDQLEKEDNPDKEDKKNDEEKQDIQQKDT